MLCAGPGAAAQALRRSQPPGAQPGGQHGGVRAARPCHPCTARAHGGARDDAGVRARPPPGSHAGGGAGRPQGTGHGYAPHAPPGCPGPPCCDSGEAAPAPHGAPARHSRPLGRQLGPAPRSRGPQSCPCLDAGGACAVGPRSRGPPRPPTGPWRPRGPAGHRGPALPPGAGPGGSSCQAADGASWHSAVAPRGPSRCTAPHSWPAGSAAAAGWHAVPTQNGPWPSSAACCREREVSAAPASALSPGSSHGWTQSDGGMTQGQDKEAVKARACGPPCQSRN